MTAFLHIEIKYKSGLNKHIRIQNYQTYDFHQQSFILCFSDIKSKTKRMYLETKLRKRISFDLTKIDYINVYH